MTNSLPKKWKSEYELHILLLDRSTFTFLVGILSSSTLRTFLGGTSKKKHPVHFGIWKKIILNWIYFVICTNTSVLLSLKKGNFSKFHLISVLQGVFFTGPAPKSSKCWEWQNPYQKSESGYPTVRFEVLTLTFTFFGRDFAILNT